MGMVLAGALPGLSAQEIPPPIERTYEVPPPAIPLGVLGDARRPFAMVEIEAGMRAAAASLRKGGKVAPTVEAVAVVEDTAPAREAALGRLAGAELDGLVLRPPADTAPAGESLASLDNREIPLVYLFADRAKPEALATFLVDEAGLGELGARAVLERLDGARGDVAILTGREGDAALAERLLAAAEILRGADAVGRVRVYRCGEEPGQAVEVLAQVTREDLDDDIRAWLFLGPWPLLGGGGALPWEPGAKAVVALGAEPALIPAMRAGRVDALVAPDYVAWGEEAAGILIDHAREGTVPKTPKRFGPNRIHTSRGFDALIRAWGERLR